MDKINFQNLPNTTTPVNATNLNQVQTNVENAINSVNTDVTNLQTEVSTKSTYSTTETVVGTWINGKPIYRKVLYISSFPNDTYTNVSHNISNIDRITNIYGTMCNPANNTTVAFNFAGTTTLYGANNVLIVRADNTNIVIGTTADWRANDGYVIIEYTKTTD